MRRIALFALGTAFLVSLATAPAQAQATRTWVSGVGDDMNPCSRTAPCKTFAGAISKTFIGGEIDCLDPGGFGTLTITKSITIDCTGTFGSVLASGTNGFNINIATGNPNDPFRTVRIRGVSINGAGASGTVGTRTGIKGVNIHTAGAAAVVLEDVEIANFGDAGVFVGLNAGLTKVDIINSHINNNGNAVADAAVVIKPISGASANVSVSGTVLNENTNGIFMDGSGGAGPSNLSVKDSVLSNNSSNGIAVSSTGGAFVATVTGSTMSLNAGVGTAVAGGSATLRLATSTISSNVTGVSNAGGTLQSFKNNVISANGTDGTPIPAFPGPGGALQ